MEDQFADAKDQLTSAFDDATKGSKFKYLPIVWTFAKELYPVMFSSVQTELANCKAMYQEVGQLVCTRSLIPPPAPASPSPPPNFGPMIEILNPEDETSLGHVFGPVGALLVEGCGMREGPA